MSNLGSFMGMAKSGDGSKITGIIRQLFNTDDLSWKIVDIDGHLNGNPLVK